MLCNLFFEERPPHLAVPGSATAMLYINCVRATYTLYQGFFKADLGVNFAPRFFGVTPRFSLAAATAVLSYTTIRVVRCRCSVELHQGRAELHQGLNLKKNSALYG